MDLAVAFYRIEREARVDTCASSMRICSIVMNQAFMLRRRSRTSSRLLT